MYFIGAPLITLNDDKTAKMKVSAQHAGVPNLVRFVFLFKKVGDTWVIYDQD